MRFQYFRSSTVTKTVVLTWMIKNVVNFSEAAILIPGGNSSTQRIIVTWNIHCTKEQSRCEYVIAMIINLCNNNTLILYSAPYSTKDTLQMLMLHNKTIFGMCIKAGMIKLHRHLINQHQATFLCAYLPLSGEHARTCTALLFVHHNQRRPRWNVNVNCMKGK